MTNDQTPGFFTVHPFSDEWTWDPRTGGKEPMVLTTIEAARLHAVAVKQDYLRVSSDQDWVASFWSEIWSWPHNKPDRHTSGEVVGYVDPGGAFHPGKPDVDKFGHLKGPAHPFPCPACGSINLEMRGQQRVYAPLDEDGEIDTWDRGDGIDWDVDDNGQDLIFCLDCDTEFTGQQGREAKRAAMAE